MNRLEATRAPDCRLAARSLALDLVNQSHVLILAQIYEQATDWHLMRPA